MADNRKLTSVKAGWVSVSKLAINSAGRTVEHLIVAAKVDDGRTLHEEIIDRLFELPAHSKARRWRAANGCPPGPWGDAQGPAACGGPRVRTAGGWARSRTSSTATPTTLENAADETIKRLTKEVKDRRKAMRTGATLTAQDKIDEARAH